MLNSYQLKLSLNNFILFCAFVQTVVCSKTNENLINALLNRVERLECKVAKLERNSFKDREIIQMQQTQIEKFQTLLSETISNCCQQDIETTTIPENINWTLKRNLTGHTDAVRSLAISREGQLISGSGDRTIKIWNVETGKLWKTLEGHTNEVFSLTISKEGQLVSGSSDRTIIVWNIETGQILKTLKGHTNFVSSLVISKEGQLVSGSADKSIKVWNIKTAELMQY